MTTPYERWYHGKEYHDCERLGITIQRVPTVEAVYARCAAIHLLTRDENGGNHNEYFDVFNQDGQRLNNTLILGQNNNIKLSARIDKPYNEPGTNFSVNTPDTINAWVGDVPGLGVIPSDRVNGFSTRWGGPIVGECDYGHISIWVLWIIQTDNIPPIPPVPSNDYERGLDDGVNMARDAILEALSELP